MVDMTKPNNKIYYIYKIMQNIQVLKIFNGGGAITES